MVEETYQILEKAIADNGVACETWEREANKILRMISVWPDAYHDQAMNEYVIFVKKFDEYIESIRELQAVATRYRNVFSKKGQDHGRSAESTSG